MSIRITQGMMYGNYVKQMQNNLGAYMNSAEQGSTQKKVNAPSDDPAASYTIFNLRNSKQYNEQLLSNCDTAKGWLKLEDSVLASQVPTVITSIKELAEQASTGTYTAEQRQEMAYQARQQFATLLNLSNTEFHGHNLFAGHRYNEPAFQSGLALMSKDEEWNKQITIGAYSVIGASEETIAFQFTSTGTVGVDPLTYRWTTDGGDVWNTGTCAAGSRTLDFNGVSVTMENDIPVIAANTTLEGVDSQSGTVYIRPTAVYQGDVFV